VNHEDERYHPTVPQVVFYQSGIGTEGNLYSEYVEGADISRFGYHALLPEVLYYTGTTGNSLGAQLGCGALCGRWH